MKRRTGDHAALGRGANDSNALPTAHLPPEQQHVETTGPGAFGIHTDMHEYIDFEPDPQARDLLKQSVAWLYTPANPDVEVKYLVALARGIQHRTSMCRALPLTLAFFIVYIVMVLTHEDLGSAGALDRHFRNMITGNSFEGVEFSSGHKTFYDIQTREDIFLFLEEALLPQLLHEDPVAVLQQEDADAAEIHRVMRYGRLIGGVQLQQRRWKEERCADLYPDGSPTQQVVMNTTCFSRLGSDDCFGPLAFGVRRPNERATMPSGFCGDSGMEGFGQLTYVPNRSLAAAAPLEGSPGPWHQGLQPRPQRPRPGAAAAKGRAAARGGAARRLKNQVGARPSMKVNPSLSPGVVFLQSDTYSVLFSEVDGMPGALRKLVWLQDNHWIDVQTQWIAVNFLILNPQLSLYSHVSVNIYCGLGGEFLPFLDIKTFPAEPYQDIMVLALDGAFVVLLGLYFAWSFVKLVQAVWRGYTMLFFKNFWNLLHMVIAFGGIVVVLMWVTAYARLFSLKDIGMTVAGVAKDSAAAVAAGNVTDMWQAEDPEYVQMQLVLHARAKEFAGFAGTYRSVVAVYGLILMFDFFRIFQMQPRLAMVAKTICYAWKDILHHTLVMFLLQAAFAVSGILIFGHRNFMFSSFVLAIFKCFNIMLGEFDWEELSEENPTLAAAWLWIYMAFMSLLMLNMLVAIIMDVYGQVKAQARTSEAVWTQVHQLMVEFFHRHDSVNPKALERIIMRVAISHNVKRMNARLLRHVIPGLSQAQADDLIQRARFEQELHDGSTISLHSMLRIIGHIHVAVQKMSMQMDRMIQDMHAEQEENRAFVEMRRQEMQEQEYAPVAEERWEPCRRFRRRATAIEVTLDRIERFSEDALAWMNYRARQLTEQIDKVETLAKQHVKEDQARADSAETSRMDNYRRGANGGPSRSQGGSRSLLQRIGTRQQPEPAMPTLDTSALRPRQDQSTTVSMTF